MIEAETWSILPIPVQFELEKEMMKAVNNA